MKTTTSTNRSSWPAPGSTSPSRKNAAARRPSSWRGRLGFSSGEFFIYEFYSLDPVDMGTWEVVPDSSVMCSL
jgi:hypothetical protein